MKSQTDKIDTWIKDLFPDGVPDVPVTIRKCERVVSAKAYVENMVLRIKGHRYGSLAQRAYIDNVTEIKKEIDKL